MRLGLLTFLTFWLLVPFVVNAQEGHHLSISGGAQLTQISNQSDYNGRSRIDSRVVDEEINPENTYNPALRIRYTYNFEDNYGFQTGLIYTRGGQSYSGKVDDTGSQSVSYTSEVKLDYLRIPLKFRFNSSLNDDVKNVFLSIGVGFGLNLLADAQLSNSEENWGRNEFELPDQAVSYEDLYSGVTGSFVADAILNIRLSDHLWIITGFNMSYGLSDIENKNYDFPEDAPLELYFPASTKKFNKPDLEARQRTRNTFFGLELGLKYHFPQSD